jgi:hypothetical protein
MSAIEAEYMDVVEAANEALGQIPFFVIKNLPFLLSYPIFYAKTKYSLYA